MSASSHLIKRAERAVHGLLLRAAAVSEVMDGQSSPEDKGSMATILGGIHVMVDALGDVLNAPQVADQQLFERMLDQADRTMDRIDAVFA
jgi:hypothetical protein